MKIPKGGNQNRYIEEQTTQWPKEKNIKKNKQQGMPGHEAWNKATVPFTTAAKAHCHLFVMKNFANFISDNKMDPSTQNALSQLCKLYAVHGIVENMGEFMQV